MKIYEVESKDVELCKVFFKLWLDSYVCSLSYADQIFKILNMAEYLFQVFVSCIRAFQTFGQAFEVLR